MAEAEIEAAATANKARCLSERSVNPNSQSPRRVCGTGVAICQDPARLDCMPNLQGRLAVVVFELERQTPDLAIDAISLNLRPTGDSIASPRLRSTPPARSPDSGYHCTPT